MLMIGVHPGRHPRAAEFNQRLRALLDDHQRLGLRINAAIDALHDEVFGDALKCDLNAEALDKLIELNVSGAVERLAYVAVHEPDCEGIDITSVLDDRERQHATGCLEELAGLVDSLPDAKAADGTIGPEPQACSLTPEELADEQVKIAALLHDLAKNNSRGRLKGVAAVAFGRGRARYFVRGSVSPVVIARLLRELREQLQWRGAA